MPGSLTGLRLSDRIGRLQPSTTLGVTAKVRELTSQGIDVIGFGVGQPDFDTPMNVKQAAIDALLAGQTKYVATEGTRDAREAIAEKLRRENDIACRAEDVVITVGAKHAIYEVMQCLVDPGRRQEVILPAPCWVSYRPIVELAGGTAVEVPGAVENDFKITPEQLRAAISRDTTAIIFNSPSNPCGTMYGGDEIAELVAVLAEHERIVVISDEIYERIIYGGEAHVSLGSFDAIAERTVTVNGLSKAFAMTGWRIGYACAPGDGGSIAKAMVKLQGQLTSNITSFAYPAVVEALRGCAEDVERMRESFASRSVLMYDAVAAIPDVRVPRPTGAFYLFPDVGAYFDRTSPEGRRVDSAMSFAEALLDEARVAVVPGEDFGDCARTHVRLSFACSEEEITEGCRRMAAWMAELR